MSNILKTIKNIPQFSGFKTLSANHKTMGVLAVLILSMAVYLAQSEGPGISDKIGCITS
jgi:hypothetical protein